MDLLNESQKEASLATKDTMTGSINNTQFINGRKRGILLIDMNEEIIQVQDKADFAKKLGCQENELLKVVSIFGNTGDGKSHTLNHAFFAGDEVFATSTSQTSCTMGIWVAYDMRNQLLIVDTEGLLSTSNNTNQRKRLLMKILAISDVIIYRSKAERLHSDMFCFLADASKAYLKHFSPELKAAIERGQLQLPLCSLGPAVVIFHETNHTEILGSHSNAQGSIASPTVPGERRSAEEILKERFHDIGRSPDAFSCIKYVGTKTRHNSSTDFEQLYEVVIELTNDNSVRSRRPLGVIHNVLCHLNEKFKGDIDNIIPDTFPDSYFTCLTHCQCCKIRCDGTMNHLHDGTPHRSEKICFYKTHFDNKYYTCNSCYERGKDNLVSTNTYASVDGSLKGLANFAWSGYVLECPECGVIYRSRQYWYGNNDPETSVVRTHIKHVWQGEHFGGINHTGRRVLDSLDYVKKTVGAISETPSRIVRDLVSDAIAPGYWIPNKDIEECHSCQHFFTPSESKHHCRACGRGFCHECSDYSLPLPDRGWGDAPVKVCNTCYEERQEKRQEDQINEDVVIVDTSALIDALEEDSSNPSGTDDLRARRVGEVLQDSVSKLALVVDFPSEIIKDFTRPSYWVADADILSCFCCNSKFRVGVSKHHCRACGQGVCGQCSKQKRAVPNRGWEHPVRVCDTCVKEMRNCRS